jgi:hypothetical protein
MLEHEVLRAIGRRFSVLGNDCRVARVEPGREIRHGTVAAKGHPIALVPREE